MASLNEEMKKKLYELLLANVVEKKYVAGNDVLEGFLDKKPIAISKRANMVFEDEHKETAEIIREENVKIVHLGEYIMYEALFNLFQIKDNVDSSLGVFYFLLMISPDNRVLNCDFFDTEMISGVNSAEDDAYEMATLSRAKSEFNNIGDVVALREFIKKVRDEKRNP